VESGWAQAVELGRAQVQVEERGLESVQDSAVEQVQLEQEDTELKRYDLDCSSD
jgi:hypothetical protein